MGHPYLDTSSPLGQHPLSPLNRGESPPPFLGLLCPRGWRPSKLSHSLARSLFIPYLEVINSAASEVGKRECPALELGGGKERV